MKTPSAPRASSLVRWLILGLIASSVFAADPTVPPPLAAELTVEPGRPHPAQPTTAPAPGSATRTFSSFDAPDAATDEVVFAPGMLKFSDAELSQVLSVYQELSGRSVIHATSLPNAPFSFTSQTPLTRREALQTLDTVLAQNGIVMIYLGTKLVKAVPAAQAASEAAPVIELPPEQLPESSSYLTYFVTTKHRPPQEIVSVLAVLAKTPGGSIVAIPGNNLLMLRDPSANIRRMLEVIRRLDVPTATPTNAVRPPGKG